MEEIAEYVCTRCWFGSCRAHDPDEPTCGDLACTCGCEPYPGGDGEK